MCVCALHRASTFDARIPIHSLASVEEEFWRLSPDMLVLTSPLGAFVRVNPGATRVRHVRAVRERLRGVSERSICDQLFVI